MEAQSLPLDTLAGMINAHFDVAAKYADKADQQRIAAGMHLKEARTRVEAGEVGDVTWYGWCGENIRRSLRDIKKCLAIAKADDPQGALNQEREATRASRLKRRENQGGIATPPAAGSDPVDYLFNMIRALPPEQEQLLWLRYRAYRGLSG